MGKAYVIGVDFGTDSVRSILIDAHTGTEMASQVFYYPRWKAGLFCDPVNNMFRQHPLDYIEGLEATITSVVNILNPEDRQCVRGIGIDTTGSTPVAVDQTGTPLALLPGFEENPNAMFVLWKDHTAIKEAEEINAHAAKHQPNYLQYVGGIYSSEWYWAKLLHVSREDAAIREAAYSWVEHCDWIPYILVGGTDVSAMKRSRCAAGHKALWHADYDGLPPNEFWRSLDPVLDGLRDNLYDETHTSNESAGTLCGEWAERLGLSQDVVVAVGAFDAHMGAVGGEIQPYSFSRIMGTSTCDVLIAPTKDLGDKLVQGICGQVDGSVVPGMLGMEAGQSAFGDVYAWFRQLIAWPVVELLPEDIDNREQVAATILDNIIPKLNEAAAQIPVESTHELAVDWFNGRRTPDANQALKGAILNLNLGSDAPRVFKALVEATCYGARAIVERFIREGVEIKEVIALGGVAKKSPFVMQTLSDVLQMPIKVARSEQTCALGAGMFAATAAGLYTDVLAAQAKMGQGFETEYLPRDAYREFYDEGYAGYVGLGQFLEKGF